MFGRGAPRLTQEEVLCLPLPVHTAICEERERRTLLSWILILACRKWGTVLLHLFLLTGTHSFPLGPVLLSFMSDFSEFAISFYQEFRSLPHMGRFIALYWASSIGPLWTERCCSNALTPPTFHLIASRIRWYVITKRWSRRLKTIQLANSGAGVD